MGDAYEAMEATDPKAYERREQRNRFKLLDTETEGESQMRVEIQELKSRIVRLDALVRHLLVLNGADLGAFEDEAVEEYMTAIAANIERITRETL
jgi:hypothetical protein